MEKKTGVKERIISAAWELFYEKGYDDTTVDDIIRLSETSKGSFYYYFSAKDALLNTLSDILDEQYTKMEHTMPEGMSSMEKLLYLNYEAHSFMEHSIKVDLLASMYSAQLIAKGERNLLDQNRKYYRLVNRIIEEGQHAGEITKEQTVGALTKYYSLCERALVSDWCLNKGSYSLGEYSKEWMPRMLACWKTEAKKEKITE